MTLRLLVVSGFSLIAQAASAQIPVPTQPPTAVPIVTAVLADSLQPFERPNGSLLRTGVVTYQLTLTRPTGEIVQLGTRTVSVTDAPLGGAPGWLIADNRTGTMVATSDSVYVTRGDLTPERWTSVIGTAQLGASFAHDSAFGAVQTYQGRASFAVGVPKNVLLSTGMVERVLELLPLREGYRAAASLLVVQGLAPVIVPAEIYVEGIERVRVGTRDVDAWRVALRWGVAEQRLWVSRDGARVVRSEQATPTGMYTATSLP